MEGRSVSDGTIIVLACIAGLLVAVLVEHLVQKWRDR